MEDHGCLDSHRTRTWDHGGADPGMAERPSQPCTAAHRGDGDPQLVESSKSLPWQPGNAPGEAAPGMCHDSVQPAFSPPAAGPRSSELVHSPTRETQGAGTAAY